MHTRPSEEIIQEGERAIAIVDASFAGVLVVDPTAHVVTLNPAAEAIIGCAPSEAIGKPLSDFFGPELWGEGSPLEKAMTMGKRVRPTRVTSVGEESDQYLLLGVAPIDEGYLLSLVDVDHLAEMKANLVSDVSHDLLGPLASIRAYAELIADGVDEGDPEMRQCFLEVIDERARYLTDMITRLTNLARVELGCFTPHKGEMSLREVAERTLDGVRTQARQRDVQLRLDAPLDLPDVQADAEMMDLMFKGLISNAVKFSPSGGEVTVSLRADGERQTLTVSDQGIGIAPEDLPYVFESFYRGQATEDLDPEGIGLGLTLVKAVVASHGGDIKIQSERGKGTRLTVSLPGPEKSKSRKPAPKAT